MSPDFVYTTNPTISFDGKRFCLVGIFDGHRRTVLERKIASKGGSFTPTASDDTDYLVLGSKGVRCCSFSCCTRVVEKAIDFKKHGSSLQFIKEAEFLDVLVT